jgi:hypothetical protein
VGVVRGVVGVWVWRGVGLLGKVLQCHVMGVGFCFLVPNCGLILQSSAEGEVFCPESGGFPGLVVLTVWVGGLGGACLKGYLVSLVEEFCGGVSQCVDHRLKVGLGPTWGLSPWLGQCPAWSSGG